MQIKGKRTKQERSVYFKIIQLYQTKQKHFKIEFLLLYNHCRLQISYRVTQNTTGIASDNIAKQPENCRKLKGVPLTLAVMADKETSLSLS